ncbi:MAG: serine hydrolase, partial [Saprospiraceae bacterium]|nr:serine hydrolase [Saprospiraceae bacterium]
ELKPLRSLVDTALQNDLFYELNANAEWAAMIRDKRLAVGLVDLRDPFHVRFARVNGNEMMYAASLPKIAILLAAMDAFEHGELMETGSVMQDLHAMIRYSNNQASTRLIDLLGYEKIEAVLTDPHYEFYDEDYGGGLWVGKRYAASGERHPDPIKGLSHAATVSQVCRFYYLLAYGELVSPVRSKQMMEIMKSPALYHKFVHTLKQIAPKATLYRKSGSWRTWHSDSVMVWGENPNRRYILVALANSPNGEQIIRRVVRVVEKVLDIQ